MEFTAISPSDRDALEPYLERLNYIDTGFTSLYYIADAFNVRWRFFEHSLAVSFDLEKNTAYTLFGIGGLKTAVSTLAKDGCAQFICVPERELHEYTALEGYQAEIELDAAYSDYVCSYDDFVSLKSANGRRKCKDYSRFTARNAYAVRELTRQNSGDARELMEKWCAGRECSACELGCEKKWIYKLLDGWDALPAKGLIVDIDGVPQGYAIAELCGETMLRLVGKPVGKQEGLHVFMGVQSALQLFPEAKYVNSGADMGLAGLATMKQKFKPYTLLPKYTVTLKKV